MHWRPLALMGFLLASLLGLLAVSLPAEASPRVIEHYAGVPNPPGPNEVCINTSAWDGFAPPWSNYVCLPMNLFLNQNCDDGDTGDTGGSYVDDDGDGWSVEDGDCDDNDPDINPDATEVCDDLNVDEDCNGVSDDEDEGVEEDGMTIWYLDGDEDGYGNPDDYTLACDQPDNHVLDDTDCDDTSDHDGDGIGEGFYTNPSIVDDCTDPGVDNNCDGNVDEEASALPVYFADEDGDGFGNLDNDASGECEPEDGYVLDSTDCDDVHDTVYPGAEELEDGLDNDCDGNIPELMYLTDTDGDDYNDAICVSNTLFDHDYRDLDAYAVGYTLFAFSWDSGDEDPAYLGNEFHCLEFLGRPADDNVEFTLISAGSVSDPSVNVDLEDMSDWVWQQNFDLCDTAEEDSLPYQTCAFQGTYDYLYEVNWDGAELSPSGDGA